MEEEPQHRTVEQVLNDPCVEACPQKCIFERMVEQSVESHVHQSVEETVAQRPLEVHKFSSQRPHFESNGGAISGAHVCLKSGPKFAGKRGADA